MLEFKRSTAEQRRVGETLCAHLLDQFVGIVCEGGVVGLHVANNTWNVMTEVVRREADGILYNTEEACIRVESRLYGETAWRSLGQMAAACCENSVPASRSNGFPSRRTPTRCFTCGEVVPAAQEPTRAAPLTEAAARLRTLADLIALRRRLRRAQHRGPVPPPEREPP